MANRIIVHRTIAAICLIAGAIIIGLAFSSVSVTRVLALVLGGGWLIMAGLAWWESARPFPPPAHARGRQYPRSHVTIVENGPQNPVG